MFSRASTEIAGNARVGGCTYIVSISAPLPKRPKFVQVTVEADDGRKRSFIFPDDQPYITGSEAVALGLEHAEALPPHLRPKEAAR